MPIIRKENQYDSSIIIFECHRGSGGGVSVCCWRLTHKGGQIGGGMVMLTNIPTSVSVFAAIS